MGFDYSEACLAVEPWFLRLPRPLRLTEKFFWSYVLPSSLSLVLEMVGIVPFALFYYETFIESTFRDTEDDWRLTVLGREMIICSPSISPGIDCMMTNLCYWLDLIVWLWSSEDAASELP